MSTNCFRLCQELIVRIHRSLDVISLNKDNAFLFFNEIAKSTKKKVLGHHQPNSPRSTHLLSAVISLKKDNAFLFFNEIKKSTKKKRS